MGRGRRSAPASAATRSTACPPALCSRFRPSQADASCDIAQPVTTNTTRATRPRPISRVPSTRPSHTPSSPAGACDRGRWLTLPLGEATASVGQLKWPARGGARMNIESHQLRFRELLREADHYRLAPKVRKTEPASQNATAGACRPFRLRLLPRRWGSPRQKRRMHPSGPATPPDPTPDPAPASSPRRETVVGGTWRSAALLQDREHQNGG